MIDAVTKLHDDLRVTILNHQQDIHNQKKKQSKQDRANAAKKTASARELESILNSGLASRVDLYAFG